MKEIVALLGSMRALYQETVNKTLEPLREQRLQIIKEPILRGPAGEPVFEGAFEIPMRIDAFIVDGESSRSIRIDSEHRFNFDPFVISWREDLEVEINPYFWDLCKLTIDEMPKLSGHHPLRQWFLDCFDVPEKRGKDVGVVHFLSDPETDGQQTSFELDLGSAGPEAIFGLLNCLSTIGIRRARFGD
jgi:hypothetical protein